MIIQESRKGLVALKTMASCDMPQCILITLFNNLIVSVIEYGLGLLTLSAAQHKRLEVIYNEGMQVILGCTDDASAVDMRHVLNLPPASERHKLAQVSAYMKIAADKDHALHDKVGRPYT